MCYTSCTQDAWHTLTSVLGLVPLYNKCHTSLYFTDICTNMGCMGCTTNLKTTVKASSQYDARPHVALHRLRIDPCCNAARH